MEDKFKAEIHKNTVLQVTVNPLIKTKDNQKAQLEIWSQIMKNQEFDIEKVKATKGGEEAAKAKKELK